MLPELPDQLIYALSQTFFHSLWQGVLVVIIWAIVNSIPGLKSSSFKYSSGILAMVILLITSGITFSSYFDFRAHGEGNAGLSENINLYIISYEAISNQSGWLHTIQNFFILRGNWIAQIWLVGIILLLLRFIMGYAYLSTISAPSQRIIHDTLTQSITGVKARMGIRANVGAYASHQASGPMLIGWIRPVILFPVALVNVLTIEETEAILAHELAHLKRHDWILNIIQSLIEILFYYHPAIWWLSGKVRESREECCDDLVMAHGYSPVFYAKVLLRVKEFQWLENTRPALSLLGNSKVLISRIQRILGHSKNFYTMKEKIIALGLITAGIFIFTSSSYSLKDHEEEIVNEIESLEISEDIYLPLREIQDTLPERKVTKSITIEQDGDRSNAHIEIEDGKIIQFKVDGKEVDPSEYDLYKEKLGINDQDFSIRLDKMRGNRLRGREGQAFPNFQFDEEFLENFAMPGFKMDTLIMKRFPQGFFQWNGDKSEMPHFFFKGDSTKEGSFFYGFGEGFEESMEGLKEQMKQLGLEGRLHIQRNRDLYPGWADSLRIHSWDRENMDKMRQKIQEQALKYRMFNLDSLRNLEFDFDHDFRFDTPPQMYRNFGGNVQDKLGYELNKDGLLLLDKSNQVELTGKHLKINGQKQPDNIYEKYKRLFEEYSGIGMSKNSHIEFEVTGKKHKGISRRL